MILACVKLRKKKNITVGREDGEEYFTKGMENIFQKIIVDNFPTVEKKMPHFVPEAQRTASGKGKGTLFDILVKTIEHRQMGDIGRNK